MIDTLKYTRDLEKAGLAPEVAEMLVRGQMSMITDNVATKLDILELKAEFKAEIKELSAKMNAQDSKFELQVQRMTNRLGAIVIGSMGALGALMTFLSAG